MGFWKKASQEAYASALKAAKIDTWESRVVLILVAAAVAGITWMATGDAASFIRAAATIAAPIAVAMLLFIVKLVGAPGRLEAQMQEARDKERKELAAKAESLQADVLRLTAEIERLNAPPPPPARDPDGLYQHGQKVGEAVAAHIILVDSKVVFGELHADQLDLTREFEYREWTLAFQHSSAHIKASTAGHFRQTLRNATCRIERRAEQTAT